MLFLELYHFHIIIPANIPFHLPLLVQYSFLNKNQACSARVLLLVDRAKQRHVRKRSLRLQHATHTFAPILVPFFNNCLDKTNSRFSFVKYLCNLIILKANVLLFTTITLFLSSFIQISLSNNYALRITHYALHFNNPRLFPAAHKIQRYKHHRRACGGNHYCVGYACHVHIHAYCEPSCQGNTQDC